jgi:hypothetical protein
MIALHSERRRSLVRENTMRLAIPTFLRRPAHIWSTLAALALLAAVAASAPARASEHHGHFNHGWHGRPRHGGFYGHRHYWPGYPLYFYAPPPPPIYIPPPPPVVYAPPPPVVFLPPPPSINFSFSWQNH